MVFWKHIIRGSKYLELGVAELQASNHKLLYDGCPMLVYVGLDGKLYVRAEAEFKDGRFEEIPDL